jgi:hypothetical protein
MILWLMSKSQHSDPGSPAPELMFLTVWDPEENVECRVSGNKIRSVKQV